mgnify:CR=1 FL=1
MKIYHSELNREIAVPCRTARILIEGSGWSATEASACCVDEQETPVATEIEIDPLEGLFSEE